MAYRSNATLPESALGGYLYEPHLAGAPVTCSAPPALRRDGEQIARIALAYAGAGALAADRVGA